MRLLPVDKTALDDFKAALGSRPLFLAASTIRAKKRFSSTSR
jgi:hypothetical protein